MSKFLKIVNGIFCALFFICVIFFCIFPISQIAIVGVAAGIISMVLFLVLSGGDNDDWWREVEDLDQQKIYEDEY